MPLDARPASDAGDSGYLLPGEAAALTPVGTIREPYFASLIDVVREIIADDLPVAE
ncbi:MULTISPECIES: hypothetical protein [Thalassobaculum]|uniref:Uncharacterized protein n=1 Tax=Thalassobaculum litoreum DSM 18839 TaxID=1123362 RepID=A0A8G2F4U7_9PROT|nr:MULTISPECIES: hypothetical protein [Thalassobaculum]SDG30700.1 hypothetical protein SAMN05660686_03966 [Thalassobaculum litoreum DSM 18839]